MSKDTASSSGNDGHFRDCLAGGGETGALMLSLDWSKTDMGPVETWSPVLRAVLGSILNMPVAMVVLWGEHYVQLYNDGYRDILQSRHPSAMGQRGSVTWREVWSQIQPIHDTVLKEGRSLHFDDLPIPVARKGFVEEAYFKISYSPIPDLAGGRAGILVSLSETTGQILGERRLHTLQRLTREAFHARTMREAGRLSLEALGSNAKDLPFALLYVQQNEDGQPLLIASTGAHSGSEMETLSNCAADAWPWRDVLETSQPVEVAELPLALQGALAQPAATPCRRATLLPLDGQGHGSLVGFLVVGVSAQLELDAEYRSFLALTSSHLSTALSNAHAHEEAQRRAEQLAELDRVNLETAERLLAEARAATRARDDMVAVISHDLRSPLSAIRNAAELIGRARVEGEQAERVRNKSSLIQRSVDSMDRLLGDLLDVSSIESGTLTVDPRPEDARAIAAEIRDTFVASAQEKQIELTFDVDSEVPAIPIDKDRIVQALSNLIGNAIKFTPEGGSVRISLKRSSDGISFSVTDTGTGISAEAITRIFDPYWHSAQRGRKGHGLGLSIAKGIVDAHGGRLFVDSESGRGSTFSINLPASGQRISTNAAVTDVSRRRAEQKSPTENSGKLATLEALEGANQQLRLASDQLQAILDQGLFMARLELDGTLIDVNRSALEVPGFRREEVQNQPFWDCGWWNRAPEVQAWVKEAVRQAASGVVFRGDCRYFWADGSEHVVDFACLPIRDASGKVILLVATGMDITERVHAEHHQRALEEERQRTTALAVLDRTKTEFFSNVSHELRTPLTLILGPVEDALAQQPGTLSGEKLELVRRNALRLHKMVNTLLDFSRMEAGRAQATYVPSDLAAFTTNLASAFESAATSAGLKLAVACLPLPELVYVDPEMWEKIVLNLLSNALKYTYEGEIRISLRGEDANVVLTVQDTGVGIPEDELPRVFERFYRVRATQGRSYEGTGIGLALVQELVKLHGGSVAVESTLGEGTTFTVRLPRGAAHLPSERVEHAPRPDSFASGAAAFVQEARRWSSDAPELEGTDPDGAEVGSVPEIPPEIAASRILLVDDNADLRAYVSGLLRRVFPNVQLAVNGLDALQRARTEPPDLVLSDVMMPELDGLGLVRELRADERTRAIPIILLSARTGEEPTVEGLQIGADDYLVKPFSARELLARVRTQLEMARVRRAVARHEFETDELRARIAARDEFLSVASHELRTPLTALEIHLERLLKLTAKDQPNTANGAVTAKVTAALRQTDRLTRLTDAILDVSRLAMGSLELEYEDFDLAEVCREVVRRFDDDARAVESSIHLDAVSTTGRWDRSRIEEALGSLVSNAIKFGPGMLIDLRLASLGDDVRLVVHDAGAGIAAEDLDRIFGRFERAVSARHHGGLGIGLYLARQIFEAHGGTIHVASSPGSGATFTVELPRRPPRSHADGTRRIAGPKAP